MIVLLMGNSQSFAAISSIIFSLFKLSFYKKVCAFFCYFSCASKKSKEYKQKAKYKFSSLNIFQQA